MSIADNRTNAIKHWLSNTLNLRINQFEIASSDASFRRYFRVIHSKGQHIVMDAPPEKENTEPFIRIAGLLKHQLIIIYRKTAKLSDQRQPACSLYRQRLEGLSGNKTRIVDCCRILIFEDGRHRSMAVY